MGIFRRRSAPILTRLESLTRLTSLIAGAASLLCLLALPVALSAQASPQSGATTLPSNDSSSAGLQGVLDLTGPWRFQLGDDPRWADPSFDDSSWPVVVLDQPLAAQGVSPYSGYSWYRIRIEPGQTAVLTHSGKLLSLLVTPANVGQVAVYLNGVEAGHTLGMTDSAIRIPFTASQSRLRGQRPDRACDPNMDRSQPCRPKRTPRSRRAGNLG